MVAVAVAGAVVILGATYFALKLYDEHTDLDEYGGDYAPGGIPDQQQPDSDDADPDLDDPDAGVDDAGADVVEDSAAGKSPPVMDENLTDEQKKHWEECCKLHDIYDQTKIEQANLAPRLKQLKRLLERKKATEAERAEFCALVDQRMSLVQRLRDERMDYIIDGCDEFTYRKNDTRTPEQRLQRHLQEVDNVGKQLENLQKLKSEFCP
jgi:hypothetical protein